MGGRRRSGQVGHARAARAAPGRRHGRHRPATARYFMGKKSVGVINMFSCACKAPSAADSWV